ncbi:hypothetical protein CTEN210_06667 [Chaetoceros tenuissimus]|uniref:Uncharacterized protein n=1 Tax=Chaetoceros tenuissimus TaxID=426638 RepID=A0AAD3H4P4_9STRA|nr:hypothetical protein CTEN210_06667 [Chaetoceros tenuissimus]
MAFPTEGTRNPCVPMIRFSSLLSSYDSKKKVFRSAGSNYANHIFDEGALVFSEPLYLDLLEIQLNQGEQRYDHLKVLSLEYCSKKIIKAASLFNTGLSKSRESDLDSAKKCFCKALDQLNDFNTSCLEYIPPVTIYLLTSIAKLNLGHLEFQQLNFGKSCHFYHQSLDHLKSLRNDLDTGSIQSEMHEEALFYSSYIMAACLNCIGIAVLKKEITDQGEEYNLLIQAKAKACLKYLQASITLYEECSRYHNNLGDSLTFNANMATAFNNLGRVYYIMDDFEQSLESYTVCLNLRLLSLPANHLDISIAHFNMGQALQALRQEGDKEEVLDHYQTFLAIAVPILGYADVNVVKAVVVVTDIYTFLGRFVEAESILQEYLSSSSITSYEALKSKVILLTTLSTVYASQQKLRDSLDTLLQAQDLILNMPEDDFLVRFYIANSSNIAILTRNGNYEQANGRRIMLAQLCVDKNMYPLHAAAA